VSLETPVGDDESLYGDLIEDLNVKAPHTTTAEKLGRRSSPGAPALQPADRAPAPLRTRRASTRDRGGRRRPRHHARAPASSSSLPCASSDSSRSRPSSAGSSPSALRLRARGEGTAPVITAANDATRAHRPSRWGAARGTRSSCEDRERALSSVARPAVVSAPPAGTRPAGSRCRRCRRGSGD
jgi:hypothetical protein